MHSRRRSLFRVLAPALLLVAGLVLPARATFAAYPEITHLDGYLSASGSCLMLREHDGRTFALRGETRGLLSGDHARLEGRFAPDPGCGAPGFEVTMVQTLWSDDYHHRTTFDYLTGEPFQRYAERAGRFEDTARHDYDRDRDPRGRDLPDRYGRYVYQGPHREVTLVGRLHEAVGACPTLETSRSYVVALDGNLGDYQAGDSVSVSGVLFDSDPNAPCGGPTVLLRSIRGHRR
jgi:hypothetical protein